MKSCATGLPLSRAELEVYLELLQELDRRRTGKKIERFYPESGPLRRDLYPRHMEFFRNGATDRERLLLAANRVGKTEGVGAYELTLHLTGQYPPWWNGRRFDRAVDTWASGDTGKTTRDIIQKKLLGPIEDLGSGLIPRDLLVGRPMAKQGINDAFEIIRVRHVSGGVSVVGLKSYDQKRESFQGTEKDVIYLDEEPPLDVYTECLLRTMTSNGIIMCTFTPLLGMSEVVLLFLQDSGAHS